MCRTGGNGRKMTSKKRYMVQVLAHFFWKQLTALKEYDLAWVGEQLKMKTNWLALGYPKYLEWNLLWYNFCTNFAQRETLTNVHPAATAAVARKLCNFFSFAFHPQTSVATTTYCCCCSMNAVERKFHMKCQIAFFLWVSIALQVNIFLHFAWNWVHSL